MKILFNNLVPPALIFILTSLTSCSDSPITNNGNKSVFMVQYNINSVTTEAAGELTVTLTNEFDDPITTTIDQRRVFDTIIGPVAKGFEANLHVVAVGDTKSKLRIFTNIYVKKDDGMYGLRASDASNEPRDSVSLFYKIDK